MADEKAEGELAAAAERERLLREKQHAAEQVAEEQSKRAEEQATFATRSAKLRNVAAAVAIIALVAASFAAWLGWDLKDANQTLIAAQNEAVAETKKATTAAAAAIAMRPALWRPYLRAPPVSRNMPMLFASRSRLGLAQQTT